MKSKYLAFAAAALISVSALVFFLRSPEKDIRQKINPPVPGADLPFFSCLIDPNSSAEIIRPTGTRIIVKPGTFCRKNGKPLQEPVELKVREFHSASDILRAGIPMSIDGNREQFLQSAGMIEVRAFSEGEELSIGKDKSVDIELAAFRGSDGYQLFYLDESGIWNTRDSFTNNRNSRKEEQAKALSVLPTPPDTSIHDIVFELGSNFFKAPELKSLAGQKWKILKGYDGPDTRQAMRSNWDDIKVKELDKSNQIYEMKFSRMQSMGYGQGSVEQQITIRAVPLDNSEAGIDDRNLMKDKMDHYNLALEKIEKAKELLKAEADMLNCFKMTTLGVYNIDKVYYRSDLLISSVSFDFESELDPDIYKLKIFAVHLGDNSVIPYAREDWKHVRFVPDGNMKLIVLLPDNQMAVADQASILAAMRNGREQMHISTRKYHSADYLKKMEVPLAVK